MKLKQRCLDVFFRKIDRKCLTQPYVVAEKVSSLKVLFSFKNRVMAVYIVRCVPLYLRFTHQFVFQEK